VEKLLGVDNLYDLQHMDLVHHVVKALQAYSLYKRDVDYVVKDGEVIIVDEFTGRLMPGRRWSDGLHQAVEAKEGVKIANENQTLASVTFQNYFRMYKKLAGMTGTADTEAGEFAKIYNLDVNVVPTNRSMVRKDYADVVFRTEKEKFTAIVEEIKDCNERGQPVLVGTVSIEKSERLSGYLSRSGVKHNVLNAKFHEKEAEIIAQAGRKGAVTIATNMAGRGTDILLGGNADFLFKRILYQDENLTDARKQEIFDQIKADCEKDKQEVVAAGGLHILGTERHESRRIDNQLRGRAGRQGDPGSSRFYLSLEDDLMRIFASERVSQLMLKLGMEEGVPIEHGMVTRAIANAQKKVEAHNFEIRKQLLEYDDVMNKQREVIYQHRHAVLAGEHIQQDIHDMMRDIVNAFVETYCPADQYQEEWDFNGLGEALQGQFALDVTQGHGSVADHFKDVGRDALIEDIQNQVRRAYDHKEQELGSELMRYLEKMLLAPGDRPPLERSPARHGPPAGRHRPARVWAKGPADRVQARRVRHVLLHDGPDQVGCAGADVSRPGRAGRATAPSRTRADPSASHGAQSQRRTSHANGPEPGGQNRSQRSLPLRERKKIQEVPRGVTGNRHSPFTHDGSSKHSVEHRDSPT
jgi:preprotein translocase subunit SecA